MYIEVGPARRPGQASAIYDQSLQEGDLGIDPDGGVTLTIDAKGINCQKSRYRYRVRLTASEAKRLARAASGSEAA